MNMPLATELLPQYHEASKVRVQELYFFSKKRNGMVDKVSVGCLVCGNTPQRPSLEWIDLFQDLPIISYKAVLIRGEVVIAQFIPKLEPKRIIRIEQFILLRCITCTGQLTIHQT